jgi:hypothetical protein
LKEKVVIEVNQKIGSLGYQQISVVSILLLLVQLQADCCEETNFKINKNINETKPHFILSLSQPLITFTLSIVHHAKGT